jgi:eukaryotic-like serine/threonine-protein kinase
MAFEQNSNDRWQRVSRLYHAALARPAVERAAFLEEASSGDEALRSEVASMLKHGSAGGFLDQSGLADIMTAAGAAEIDDLIGRDLDGYRVTARIGAGGMGVVYKAVDAKFQRPVAIKLLSAEMADTAARRRFMREAQTASSLNHPHILTVHDIGDVDGRQYLVTEFVDGGTLRDWAKAEPRTWQQVVDLLVGVADALATAHQAGIIHRDIKPQNILVSTSGYAKLADFGLAKMAEAAHVTRTVDAASEATRWGTVMGTAGYMSPEQAAGAIVDARSDIFSFGIVLHEMLSGRRPFAAESTAQELQRIINGAPDPLPASAPRRLHLIVEKALRKVPEHRYQTMRELVLDLRHVIRQSGDPAPTRPRTQVAKWIAAALGVLLAGALALWFMRDTERTVAVDSGNIRSLAVLPLKPLEASKEDDYLGLGLADTIITRIGQIEGMTVRPTSAVRKFAAPDSDPLKAGHELQAEAVLDGTVQRVAGRVRVNVSLLRVRDGAALWSDTFNVSLDDLFALEDEISQRVVSQLRLQLSAAERLRLTKQHTSNPQAYEYYLRGVATFATVGPASPTLIGDVKEGVPMLEQAVRLDPNYALAYAQLAWAYTWLGLQSDGDAMLIERARAALARADALDPNLAESHVVRHLLLWSAFEGYQILPAFEELRTAQRINPNVGHFELGELYTHVGLLEQGLRELRRALEIDPTNESVQNDIPNSYWYNALYDDAIAADLKLEHPVPWNYFYYIGAGRTDEGRRMVDQALARNPKDPIAAGGRFWLLALEGKYSEARKMLTVAGGEMNRTYHHATYLKACVSALTGDATSTVQWADATVKNGMPIYPAFSRDKCFDKVRGTSEFAAFMAKLKPVWEEYERVMR